MLKDIPYTELKKDERAYKIMLLRDQYNSTFADIAQEFDISVRWALQIYNSLKYKQKHLYINHISIALGHKDCIQVGKIYKQAYECYKSLAYACAYLEEKYKDILIEYRNGEPGMPAEFIQSMPPLKDKPTDVDIKRVVEMKEEKKASFAEIAREFNVTKEKAKHIYNGYYHAKAIEIVKTLQKKTESEEEKWNIRDYCFENKYSSKKRYEMLLKKYY